MSATHRERKVRRIIRLFIFMLAVMKLFAIAEAVRGDWDQVASVLIVAAIMCGVYLAIRAANIAFRAIGL